MASERADWALCWVPFPGLSNSIEDALGGTVLAKIDDGRWVSVATGERWAADPFAYVGTVALEPVSSTGHVEQSAHELVIQDLHAMSLAAGLLSASAAWMTARMMIGLQRYGKPLLPDDDRDGMRDAIEEAADLVAYLKNLRRQGRSSEPTYRTALNVLLALVAEQLEVIEKS